MNGPQNEETALTTCPAVRLLVNSFGHHIVQQRIERHLQDGVADSQQGIPHKTGPIGLQQRNEHTHKRDRHTEHDGVLAPPGVHLDAHRYAEKQKPDEDHRRHETGHGMAPTERFARIIRRNTDNVTKAHHKEPEQNGKDRKHRCLFFHVVFIF